MKTQSEKRKAENGRENRALIALAWPLVVTNLLNVAVGIADMKMVGVLGVNELAGVGASRQVYMLILTLMIAISGGASVLVSHAHGAADGRRVSQVASRSVVFMLVAALVLIMPLGLLFSGDVLGLLGARPEVLEIGKIYLQIIFAGSLFTMFNFVTTGILLGVGLTRVSMVILAFVNGLNILLNYVFIFGLGPIPAFGVAGAAIGTVVARGVGSVACFWVLRHPDFSICINLAEGLKPDLALVWQIVRLGGPRALQGLVRNGSRLAIVGIIGFLAAPTRSLAAYNVGMQVRFISTFVGLAFMQATMSRVGRNLGAGRPDLAEQSGHHGARLAAVIMAIAAAFFLLFPNQIMGFFSDDADVIALGRSFFMTVALTEPIMGLAFAYGGALRGGGDSLSPFIFAALSDLVVILGVGYVLGVGFNLGIQGIAIGVAAGVITRAIPCWFQFTRGQWKKNRLV